MKDLQAEHRELQNALLTIEQNRDMSREGKDKQAAPVKSKLAAFRNTAATTLAAEREALRKRAAAIADQHAAAQEKSAARWDFQRMNYEAARWGGVVGKVSPAELAAQFARADSHGKLALADMWERVAAQYANRMTDAAPVVAALKAHSTTARITDELRTLASEAEQVAGEAWNAANTAHALGQALHDNPVFTPGETFGQLSNDLLNISRELRAVSRAAAGDSEPTF